ncbi:ABC transporter ATP-binding protein [Christensenellaceae bacterium OttesenSCG-928-L17]|nr:ABC transporter ATP-binding protein [Christensenellaceae bacterium OttesenSCG-928-L17]
MSALFVLQHVSAGYGSKAVVEDISLDLRAGEFCAMLGLNGSGKTTLLKAVSGLIPMQSGRCLVNDIDCTHLNEHKRARYMSYIPQRHSKLLGVSVQDVVLMGRNPHLNVFESPNTADRERAEALLVKMGMDEAADQDFSRLSEGQKQLVILTRALLQDTPIMLMDEPDSALDYLNRHKMMQRLRGLIHTQGKAGLVTLHDPGFALAYCDRLVLLHEGRLVAELSLPGASAQEIREKLALIYGELELVLHDGRYLVLMG